jgi:hypothetical protein
MLLSNAQIRLTEKALKDYDFIKGEIDEKIKKGYTLKQLDDFISKFNGIEVYNLEEEEGYLDFYYNALNSSIVKSDNVISLVDNLSIYDKTTSDYVFTDVTRDYVDHMINSDVFELLCEELDNYKILKNNNFTYKTNLEDRKKNIIKFIEENL